MRELSKLMMAVLFAAFLAAPASAEAPETGDGGDPWVTSFDPATVGTLAIVGRPRVALVAVGERSQSLDDARLALVAAIRASGKMLLIDGALVRELDDDADDDDVVIAERNTRSVDAIWIVRLMPGKNGAPDDAIVTIYSPLGPLLNAFQVAAGAPLRVVVARPDYGAEYLRQRISPVAKGHIVTAPAPEEFGRAGFAKDGVRLDDPRHFYMAVGRYDLLAQYDDVAADRSLATIISGGAIFVGGVLFMHDVFNDGGVPSTRIGALGISGAAVAGLGIAGVIYARLMDPDPLDWSGKVGIATQYNADLKTRLTPRQTLGSNRVRVASFGVAPIRRGLGLTLGLAF